MIPPVELAVLFTLAAGSMGFFLRELAGCVRISWRLIRELRDWAAEEREAEANRRRAERRKIGF